jgi:hypothetical protein
MSFIIVVVVLETNKKNNHHHHHHHHLRFFCPAINVALVCVGNMIPDLS